MTGYGTSLTYSITRLPPPFWLRSKATRLPCEQRITVYGYLWHAPLLCCNLYSGWGARLPTCQVSKGRLSVFIFDMLHYWVAISILVEEQDYLLARWAKDDRIRNIFGILHYQAATSILVEEQGYQLARWAKDDRIWDIFGILHYQAAVSILVEEQGYPLAKVAKDDRIRDIFGIYSLPGERKMPGYWTSLIPGCNLHSGRVARLPAFQVSKGWLSKNIFGLLNYWVAISILAERARLPACQVGKGYVWDIFDMLHYPSVTSILVED